LSRKCTIDGTKATKLKCTRKIVKRKKKRKKEGLKKTGLSDEQSKRLRRGKSQSMLHHTLISHPGRKGKE